MLQVLGPLVVVRDGETLDMGGYRQRLVLAVLVAGDGRPSSADALAAAVWGEHPPRTARKTLQAYVTRLRRLLGAEAIETTRAGYALRLTPGDLDAHRFIDLAEQGRGRLADDPAAALGHLDAAIGLWRGRAYGELADEPALGAAVEQLTRRLAQALQDRVAARLACGHAAEALDEAAALAAADPMDERVIALHMQALYASGRPAEALREFDRARRVLADELGVDPSPGLLALHEQILCDDPSLPRATTPVDERPPARNPYKGLRGFGESDAGDFCGREELTQALVNAVETRPFVAVVGASGSGKSSVVRAGLVPALRGHDPPWAAIVMSPGAHPFEELRHAAHLAGAQDVAWRGDTRDALRSLRSLVDAGASRALLVVDQFEELLTLTDGDVADRFVANLAAVSDDPRSRCAVLVALRADFVERALATAGIADRLADGFVVVPPMGPADVEAAAVKPAARVGVSVEPDLVAVLAADMQAQPGALPLFQYALTTAFDSVAGRTMGCGDYQAVGGMSGALARRAEEVFQTFGPHERDAVRQVFLRLVAVDPRGSATGRRVARRELESLGLPEFTTAAVLDAFDRARLLTFDRDPDGDPTVELAHEALIDGWPRLAGWLDEVLDDLRLHRRLAAQVAEWVDAGRSDDYLVAGSRLAAFDGWPAAGSIRLSADERTFMERSRQARDEVRRRERWSRRRLRALVALATVAAVTASALAVVSVRSNAELTSTAQAAQAGTMAEASLSARDADLAVLLGREAVRTAERSGRAVPLAYDALHQALDRHRLVAHVDDAAAVAFTGDGSLVVAGERTRVIDPVSGEEVATLDAPGPVGAVATSADGGTVLAGMTTGGLLLWDAQTQTVVEGFPADVLEPEGERAPVVALSPDGRWAAARGAYQVALSVWSTETGEMIGRLSYADDATFRVGEDFRLDDLEISNDSTVHFANRAGVQSGTGGANWRTVVPSDRGIVTDLGLTADGRVLTTVDDGTLSMWEPGGARLASLEVAQVALTSLAVAADGRVIVLDSDGTVHVVAVGEDDLTSLRSFAGSDRPLVGATAWASLAAAVDDTGRAYVWDLSDQSGGELGGWPGDGPVAVSRDGQLVATGGADLSVDVYSLVDDSWVTSLAYPESGGAVFDPGGPPGAPAWLYDGLTTRLAGLAFTPAGRVIATYQYAADSDWVTEQPVVAVLDVQDGDPIQVWKDWRVVFGPLATSGSATRAAAVCSGGAAAWVFTVSDDQGELTGLLPLDQCGRSVDLDAAGRRVAVQVAEPLDQNSDDPDAIQVWSLDTLELVAEADHAPATGGSVRFSPDGATVLSAGRDGTARVWDAETGDQVAVLRAGPAPMEAAEWAADGRKVVTSSQDGVVRVWDMPSATLAASISVAERGTWPHVALTPDGQHLLTSSDGLVRQWTLDTTELLRLADQRATRELTQAECTRYDIDPCPG